MRKLRSLICLASIVAAGAILVLINPLYAVALGSMCTFIALAGQMTFQRMLAIMKQLAKNVTRLRLELRAKIHTGYTQSFDNEETRRRTSSMIR